MTTKFEFEMSPAAEVTEIVKQLDSEYTNEIVQALRDIATYSPNHAQLAVPRVIALVMHHAVQVRQQALIALMSIGTDEKLVVYATRKCLYDERSEVRKAAACCLGKFGASASDAVYELADRAINDTESIVKELCCHAISEIGPLAVPALPALVQLLQTGGEMQRISAARALTKLAPFSHLSKPALVQSLSDENQHVRAFASQALEKMSPELKYG